MKGCLVVGLKQRSVQSDVSCWLHKLWVPFFLLSPELLGCFGSNVPGNLHIFGFSQELLMPAFFFSFFFYFLLYLLLRMTSFGI